MFEGKNSSRREFLRQTSTASLMCLAATGSASLLHGGEGAITHRLQAGTACVDVTPQKLPVLVCGGFLSASANQVNDPLFARCLVLDDGSQRVLIMVVDTLEIPFEMHEGVKAAASAKTGIPTDRMLISTTHTHSAGSLVSALGTKADPEYSQYFPGRLVECIVQATKTMRPARIGWSSEQHPSGTHCRIFIRRPDCLDLDPLGRRNVRAMMHPGYQNPEFIGPCGPADPEISVLALQSPDGKPLALLANYSMHYFGAAPVSADYYGDFVRTIAQKLAPSDNSFIAMMSHGTSGDQQWQDYADAPRTISREQYANEVADAALRAYRRIEFVDSVPIAMAERRLTIRLQQPDAEMQAWSDKLLSEMQGREPQTRSEVYAREIALMKEQREAVRKLQVLRIGDVGIAALPAEVYAITGLKLKQQCPLPHMFNVELANGSIGYIPPPELRPLGGYNTWPARHTATQDDIEPIIVRELLGMFEEITGKPRREIVISQGPQAARILAQKPAAYWRLGEIEGDRAWDISGNGNHGTYEIGHAFYLDGPDKDDLRGKGQSPRAVQFAGGRMKAHLALGRNYCVEFWFWNGLPNDNRGVAGYLFSLGPDRVASCPGDHLGIAGTASRANEVGRLFFYNGNERKEFLAGGPVIVPKTWNHVRLMRRGDEVSVQLNDGAEPIFSGRVSVSLPDAFDVFVGGRSDNFANFEGRMAEVAVYAMT